MYARPPAGLAELTLDQLLTHQRGVVDRLNRVELRDDDRFTEPGTLFSYSSLGYTLAGRIRGSRISRVVLCNSAPAPPLSSAARCANPRSPCTRMS